MVNINGITRSLFALQQSLTGQAQGQGQGNLLTNVGNPVQNQNINLSIQGSGNPTTDNLIIASAFRAVSSAVQSVPANTFVKVQYPNQQFDLDNEYNPATSTFIPKTDGVYLIIGSVGFGPDVITTPYNATIDIRVNGSVSISTDNDFFSEVAPPPAANAVSCSTILQLNAGDVVEVFFSARISGLIIQMDSNNRVATHFEAARFPSPTT